MAICCVSVEDYFENNFNEKDHNNDGESYIDCVFCSIFSLIYKQVSLIKVHYNSGSCESDIHDFWPFYFLVKWNSFHSFIWRIRFFCRCWSAVFHQFNWYWIIKWWRRRTMLLFGLSFTYYSWSETCVLRHGWFFEFRSLMTVNRAYRQTPWFKRNVHWLLLQKLRSVGSLQLRTLWLFLWAMIVSVHICDGVCRILFNLVEVLRDLWILTFVVFN